MSYLYSKLPETGVPLLIGTGGSGRRTFATRLNAKGVGMRTIQKLMGHRNIGTTALYCDVSNATPRNAVELV